MSDSHIGDVRVCDSLSPEPRLKRPTLQLALKQQAKRRRRNTSIAAHGNVNPFPRVIVKVLPPLPPLTEETRQNEVESPEFGEEEPTQTVKNVNSVPAAQTTMQEVLASIPGFKTTKRQTRNLSAAAQIQKTREGCVDLQNPSSILVHANLRGIVNKHSFSTLPVLYQHKLIQLLPEVDRCPDGSAKLNSTALSNEFFARSCQKWTERLAAGEFTPEFQQKIRAEAERDKGKLDPWKIKHFEPFWGGGRGETSSPETSKLTTNTLRASCSSSSAGSKRKVFASSPDLDEEVAQKKRSVGRRVGRKRVKRKKPNNKKMILPSVAEGEVKIYMDSQDLTVSDSIEVIAVEPEDAATSSVLLYPVSPNKDPELTDSAESTCEDERISTQAEEEELESDAGVPSVSHETSDEPLTEVSGMEEIVKCSSHQQLEEVATSMEQDDTSLDQLRSSSSGGSSEVVTDGGRSSVEQNSDYPTFIATVEEEEEEESEDGAFIDLPVKDSLPPVSSSDEEQDDHFNCLKVKEEDVVDAEKNLIETETTLNDTMEDLLGDDNVGHFVQEDSSPEDFYQSEQVTEALELLRNIHDEDDAAAAKAVAGTSVCLSQTISPINLSNSITSMDNAGASQPKSTSRDNIEPNFPTSTISLKNTVTISEGKASESNSSVHSIKVEPLQGSSTSQVTTTNQQQPPTTTTVTLTLPFPVTLPLNLPLTLPINLPPGTTLVVSDPSALMGIRPASSQSPCSTADNGKTSTSISTSFAAIAPSKLRSSTPSPSRILPRSSSHPPSSNTNSPPSFGSGTSAGASTSVARGGGISKQSQHPSKAPPGTVNLERSYRICQAVIENSPNCEQLKAQLRPPSAFSSPNPSPSSGSSSSSSSSGCAVVISASSQPVNGIIPVGANGAGIGHLSRQGGSNSKNSMKQGSSTVKSIKSNPLVKLNNEVVKTAQSSSLASASASSKMLLQSVTSGNCVHLDASKATTVCLSSTPAQLQPKQKLICIAPSKPDAPLKSHQPIAPAGSRAVGAIQRSGPQLQRSVSAPVKPSTTITLSSSSQTQPPQQQLQQTAALQNWPKQPVQIKPSFSSASVSIGIRSQANKIQPPNQVQSNSVNPSNVQQQEQHGVQVKSSIRVLHPSTNSVRPRAAIVPHVHQFNNQVLLIIFCFH